MEAKTPPSSRCWRWIVIAAFIIGIALSIWQPIWILPNAGNTIFLYPPVYFLWLVILIVISIRRHYRLRLVNLVAVVGILIVQVMLGYILVIIFSFGAATEPTCTQVSSGFTTTYTCQSKGIFAPIDCAPPVSNYQFVGLGHLPLVLKVKDDFVPGQCY